MDQQLRTPARTSWALVLGGAQSDWEEVRELEEEILQEPWPGWVFAANEVGAAWPRFLHHWVTFHPKVFPDWEEKRKANGFPAGYTRWSRRMLPGVDRTVYPWGGGSSGLLAVAAAADFGCTRVVLCGIPMTKEPHFHDRDGGAPWKDADGHWKIWLHGAAKISPLVRSMRGRTRETFGAPTSDWLQETALPTCGLP